MGNTLVDEAIASGLVPPEFSAAYIEENQDTAAIISIVVVTALASLTIACRLLSRRYVVKHFGVGLDDGIALASLFTFIPFGVLCIELINLGAGRHFIFQEITSDDETYGKIQLFDSIAHLIYSTSLLLCRISGLAFYYRLCDLHKEFLLTIKVTFAILVAGYLAQICLIIFHCRPITLMWAPITEEDYDKYECLDWYQIYATISSISLACDLLLFGIPAAMLKVLEIPRKQKIQLACILLPGVAVIGISVARVVLVIFYGYETEEEFKFAFLRLLCVEVAEIGATLIALSIPGVKPMVDKYILRKDTNTRLGGSKISTKNRNTIGSQGSALSSLKKRSQYSMLGVEKGS